MISDEEPRKPVKLSSIINVVRHDSHPGQKTSQRKMELKSVVHLGSEKSKRPSSDGVKGHELKSLKSAAEKPVLLLPFGHQVSGRASMLCYDEATILKPYVSRELFFYQSMADGLKKFTPQFRGLVTVSFVEDSATASVLAYALPRTLVKPNAKSIIKIFAEEPKPHSKRCVKDFGKTHVIYPNQSEQMTASVANDDQNLFIDSFEFSPVISDVERDDDDVVSELSQGFDVTVCIDDGQSKKGLNLSTTGLHNPWNSKVLDDAWLKLKFTDTEGDPANGKKKKFTLLENVVARYRRPCVLDLKIGTRVRENASPQKIARHVTAINLGARLSGMQIYHPKREKFTFHNKYYGHNLTVSGFKSNLRHFFSRGSIPIKRSSTKSNCSIGQQSVDKMLVEQAIEKMTRLKDTVESLKCHRFYSSSLLLLYEGDVVEETECEEWVCDDVTGNVTENCDVELKIEESRKIMPTSFTFSEFLQRIKQTGLKNGKRNRENTSSKCQSGIAADENVSSKDHGDVAHENASLKQHAEDAHKTASSDDHVLKETTHKVPATHKDEKGRRRNHESGDSQAHENHHHGCCKHHHDHDFWARSLHSPKSASKSKSPKLCDHREKLKNKGEFEMTTEKSSDHKSRKHFCEEKMEESDDFQESLDDGKHSHRDHSEYKKCHYSSQHSYGRHGDAIDVRMIDFAHYCFHDKEIHPGADGGFIFGLENLIKLLSDMLSHEVISE